MAPVGQEQTFRPRLKADAMRDMPPLISVDPEERPDGDHWQ